MPNQSLSGTWQFRKLGDSEWLPATVPGGVHADLLAIGRIPDPFAADNEKAVQWVAECDWEYRLAFVTEPAALACEKIFLACDGLDTLAEVALNSRPVGEADNQFRHWQWDVGPLLHKGENELRIIFRAPLTFIRARQAEQPLVGGGDIPGGPHLRKSPCHWGWDWGPKLPVIGVWRDIRLEARSTARIEDFLIRQTHRDGHVRIAVTVAVEAWKAAALGVRAALTAPDGTRMESNATVADGRAEIVLDVARPQLWWPNGLPGRQDESGTPRALYALELALEDGRTRLDHRACSIGLRTLELRRVPDEWGESFVFAVNGVPIFIKGADWIPSDSFPTRVTAERLDRLLGDAARAHMNMLRVWGGGYYEDDRFYEACDRYGILIWQDFMFACGIYPADDLFAESVRLEAVDNVRRLRPHACLALWCGNNEMEQGWQEWKWNNPADPANQRLKAGYDRMFHHLLPAVVAQEDPDRAYWPSSASSGIPFADPNGDQRGDMHYWEVWHKRKPFTAYRGVLPRFMSEFGFQAMPPERTIAAYAQPADRNMTSYVMEYHQRSGAGNGLMISQMTDTFRMPKNFSATVYLSMLLQAEGIRYGVEHWRRHCRRVGGTLIWQLNDCWPGPSWSSIDYFGRWKALHYAACRFYAPLLLSVEDSGRQMNLHITNDCLDAWKGMVRWRLETVTGERLESGDIAVTAAPQADTPAAALDFTGRLDDEAARRTILVFEAWEADKRISRGVAGFVPPKHLELADPGLTVETTLADGLALFRVQAAALARFVELALDGADTVFSDNYFDLPAGASANITAPAPEGWTAEQIRAALRVQSLADSYS